MSRMLPLLIASLSLPIALLSAPSTAESCSLASDYTDPPENELPFDPALAPAPPEIVRAEISHNDDEGGGCPGIASCGAYSGLSLLVQVDPADQFPVLRIEHPDGSHVYATGSVDSEGMMFLFLLGYEDVFDDLELSIVKFDSTGRPSAPTATIAVVPPLESDGCAAGGGGRSLGLLVLMALLATRIRRPMRPVS